MDDCVKETLCTNCLHRSVCKYKNDYLKILEAIKNATVYTEHSDGKQGMKKVTNYDFIGEIIVPCKFHSMIPTTRTYVNEIRKKEYDE